MTTTTSSRSTARRSRLAGASIALALLLGACGAHNPGADAPSAVPAPRSAPASTEVAATEVVRLSDDLAAYDRPDAAAATATLPATTALGSPTALLVTDHQAGWVEVLVPGRPVGATAWLPTLGLEIRRVTTEVRVDLGDRTLTVLDGGKVLLTSAIAIGSDATPTPTGRFSITDRIRSQNPAGAYGPYAIGLSARSEVLTDFAGGDGQIGIHGTDAPSSIGQPVTHGCIRVPNDVVERLVDLLPLGTPVVVGW